MHLWDEKKNYFIPSVGSEIYVQTDIGSRSFDNGVFPSVNLLFDHSLPGRIEFEYNIGATRKRNLSGHSYELSFPWSFTREIVHDLNLFVEGFYGSTTIPRSPGVRGFRRASNHAVGAGALWTVNSRIAVWSSYAFGTKQQTPDMISVGFAVAF